VPKVLGVLRDLGAGSIAHDLEPTLNQIADSSATAGLALVLGLVTALWSASGYVGSFGRAMNRIYEIREGRPFWKLRPLQIGLSAIALVLMAVVAAGLVISGPLVDAVGNALHADRTARLAWSIGRWPVLVLILMLLLSLLFWIAPNVQQPRFRWLTLGGAVALLAWAVASFGFGLYVANFGSYDKTYGTLGGMVVLLMWLWISNCALLLGLELNSEGERSRELEAGLARAEREIQLEPRSAPKVKRTT
jgi:membrane protein